HIETAIKHIRFSCSDPDGDLDETINGDAQTVLAKMAADVQMAEDALYSDDFMNPETGYRKYLDVDSFIDWRLANEIAKNYEIRLLNRQYMYYDHGKKKFCMGPLWDHDISFGNSSSYGSDTTSGCMVDKNTTNASDWAHGYEWWHVRLLQDPRFVGKIKERWNEIKPGLLSSLLTYVDKRSTSVREAQLLDIKKWNRGIDQSVSVDSLKHGSPTG
ncbi:MAG: CotH kinase family protein, partial [Treponema sp.]|nr:CotH kinase family protein [Treponema sp.]